jgi:hypothetical protein
MKIWESPWPPRDGMLQPLRTTKDNPPQWVSELIDQSLRSWNRQHLREFFSPLDWETIENIPLSTMPQDNFWACHYEKKGIFSVRSVYQMLIRNWEVTSAWAEDRPGRSDKRAQEKEWSDIWRIKVPSKIPVFLWCLVRQSIPTGDVRHCRNMALDGTCTLCGGLDSWRHALLECNLAKCI